MIRTPMDIDFSVYFAQASWSGFRQFGLGKTSRRPGLDEYIEVKYIN